MLETLYTKDYLDKLNESEELFKDVVFHDIYNLGKGIQLESFSFMLQHINDMYSSDLEVKIYFNIIKTIERAIGIEKIRKLHNIFNLRNDKNKRRFIYIEEPEEVLKIIKEIDKEASQRVINLVWLFIDKRSEFRQGLY